MGASTCALGSQRWTPYSGIFTRNAMRQPAHQILLFQELSKRGLSYRSVRKDREPVSFWRRRRATSSGSDPARV